MCRDGSVVVLPPHACQRHVYHDWASIVSRRDLLRTAGVLYGVMTLCAFGWAAACGRPMLVLHPTPWLSLEPWVAHASSAAAGLGLAAVTVAFSRIVTARYAWAQELHSALRALLGHLDLASIAFLALGSGLAEELFFRGAVQPSLGYVLSSLVFGLIHMGPDRRFRAWTPWAIVMGFALGAIHEATGSLAGPLIAHVGINFVNLRFVVGHSVPDPSTERRAAEHGNTPSKREGRRDET